MPLVAISAVRAGLADAAESIVGLRAARYVKDAIAPPTFVVGEYRQDFDLAMGRGLDVAFFTCRLYVSKADDRAGQDKLDGYLAGTGALSIKTALEVDRTLGGACKQLVVTGVAGYGVYAVAGADYLGADFSVKVWG